MAAERSSANEVRRALRRVSRAALASLLLPQDLPPDDEEGDGDLRSIVAESVAGRLRDALSRVRERLGQHLFLGDDDDGEAVQARPAAYRALSSVPPFSYLPEGERRDLVLDLWLHRYKNGDAIIEQGEKDRDVFVGDGGPGGAGGLPKRQRRRRRHRQG